MPGTAACLIAFDSAVAAAAALFIAAACAEEAQQPLHERQQHTTCAHTCTGIRRAISTESEVHVPLAAAAAAATWLDALLSYAADVHDDVQLSPWPCVNALHNL